MLLRVQESDQSPNSTPTILTPTELKKRVLCIYVTTTFIHMIKASLEMSINSMDLNHTYLYYMYIFQMGKYALLIYGIWRTRNL